MNEIFQIVLILFIIYNLHQWLSAHVKRIKKEQAEIIALVELPSRKLSIIKETPKSGKKE